jgi:hypothetical protein
MSRGKRRVKARVHQARLLGSAGFHGDSSEELEAVFLAMRHIKNYVRSQFSVRSVPQIEFEYPLKCFPGCVRIPLRDHICLVSERVALITGLSPLMSLVGDRPVPEDYVVPDCILDAVTKPFIEVLHEEFKRPWKNHLTWEPDRVSTGIYMAVKIAKDRSFCAAVEVLDEIAPDCDRELFQMIQPPKNEKGRPDPFGSKSRFRNSLIEALIWCSLPQRAPRSKRLENVTEEDLAEYFNLIRYMDTSQANRESSDKRLNSGGNDRTVRRWLEKYATPPNKDWHSVRTDLIDTISRANNPLT